MHLAVKEGMITYTLNYTKQYEEGTHGNDAMIT